MKPAPNRPAPPPAAPGKPAPPAGKPAAKPEGEEVPPAVTLKEDVTVKGTVNVEDKGLTLFRIDVPEDAILMTARVSDSPLLLDLLARKDQPIARAEDAEARSSGDVLDPALRVSRQNLPPLESGTWYLAVAYLDTAPAVVHKRPIKEIPFSLKVSFVRSKLSGVLTPGQKTSAHIQADAGSMCSFAVDVPAGAKALRIDLDGVASDLDILARRGQPLISNDDADVTAISPLGRESLVIDRNSPKPLEPGRWYINVIHPACQGRVDFDIYTSLAPEPPAELLKIPAIPCPADPRRRAIHATVDVSTEVAGASGTILTDEGLVLTNYHVVAEVIEGAADKDPVILGMILDPRDTPRELFRGRVVQSDKARDLALVQITTGLYGQPLPPGYRFPTLPLGDPDALAIGDEITILGFPSIGGTTGRVSVTMTRGVLSGFEKTEQGTLLKSDAGISPGNSGGAALDSQWRLIGVPTFENISPEAVSRMSYVHPVSMIPPAWHKLIDRPAAAH